MPQLSQDQPFEWTNFIGPTYFNPQSPFLAPEICMNQFVEIEESPGARAQQVLQPTPGFSKLLTLPSFPGRGAFYENGRQFFVAGSLLWEVNPGNFVFTARGTIADDGFPVTIDSNGKAGNQLFIVGGGQGYILNLGTNVLTNPISNVRRGGFLDGFFIALDTVTNALHRSNLYDGTVWDPTTANRSLAGDPWVSFIVAHDNIWLIGEKTGEVWYNSGASPFPFEPLPQAIFQRGIEGEGWSIAVVNNKVTWFGTNENGALTVLQESGGYLPQRISTQAIERQFAYLNNTLGSLGDMEAMVYTANGHAFYLLSSTKVNATFVYDSATGMWHQRGFWNVGTAQFDQIRIRAISAQYAVVGLPYVVAHMAIDRITGDVYTMTEFSYTEVDGTGIRRLRQSPNLITSALARQDIRNVCVDIEVGVGANTGQGKNPMLMAEFSMDGGRTWLARDPMPIGMTGQWLVRVRWERLGTPRQFMMRLTLSDPVAYRIAHVWINADD